MVKNLITHDSYDAIAAGLLDATVQIESPQRGVCRIIPSNRMLQPSFIEAHHTSNMICKVRSLKSWNKTSSLLEAIMTSRNQVFTDWESDRVV